MRSLYLVPIAGLLALAACSDVKNRAMQTSQRQSIST
jgi:hypothetical protein